MFNEAKYKANKKSDKKNGVRVSVLLNKNTDQDVIGQLELNKKNPSKKGYSKRLIREDIKNKKD
ncbi:MAG: hypothetical protein ACK5LC_11005 [Coprobacillaceae bacterium]